MRKTYLIIFLIAIVKSLLFAQDYSAKYNTRTIVLNYPDSVIKVKILNTEEDFKIKDNLNYYWYNNDMVGYNRGGVNGKPLHGTYTVCNVDGVLITQGEFRHGLKEGKWKSWYISGELKKVENFKNGLKDDIQSYYSESGEIVKETKYKNGVKLENKEGSVLKSIFNKKDKEEKAVIDSTITNVEVIVEDEDI